MAVRFKKNGINVGRIATKIVATIIAMYVGGYLVTIVSTTLLGTCSPFYKGLSLFGWSVGDNTTAIAAHATETAIAVAGEAHTMLVDVATTLNNVPVIAVTEVANDSVALDASNWSLSGNAVTLLEEAFNNTELTVDYTYSGWGAATIIDTCHGYSTILYDVSAAGLLAVVGLVGVASIVMEFIEFKM